MLVPEIVKDQICLLQVEQLTSKQWFELFRILRQKSLVASFYHRLCKCHKDQYIPKEIGPAFYSALTFSNAQTRQIELQLRKLNALFSEHKIDFVMLKGAAYVASKTTNSSGRLMSDIDICVKQQKILDTEGALKSASWQVKILDDHDEKYYREWSHEIPPYRHPFDGVSLDVHHTLFPPVSNKTIDIDALFEASELTKFEVKSPSNEWLIFHAAIHLIANEDVDNGLRDLIDIYLLLTQSEKKINTELLQKLFVRSGFQIEFFLLRQLLIDYFDFILKLPLQEEQMSSHWVYRMRLWALRRAICPQSIFVPNSQYRFARLVNYVIGYTQKMPVILLIKHLSYKGGRSIVKAILGDFYFRKSST